MRVLIVSGIWPPDVGGPASHAPELAAYLRQRGHEVRVVVTAGAPPAAQPYLVEWVRRTLPVGVRHGDVIRRVASAARASDVVYATGMFGRAALGASAARRPFVVKLTADPAYERARRLGFFTGSLDDFQQAHDAKTLPLRLARTRTVLAAAHVVTPSKYLRELAVAWGVPPDRVTIVPNPVPVDLPTASRDDLRRKHGFDGPTLLFAGRLTAQKALDTGIEAARRAGVALVVAGDGPERERLTHLGRATFLGALARTATLELLAAADASLLSSSWENFPHAVVESLAVGTPVIATDVGGVREVVRDGENGLLVPPDDVAALTAAIERFAGAPELAARLRANAAASVQDHAPDRVYGELERILRESVR